MEKWGCWAFRTHWQHWCPQRADSSRVWVEPRGLFWWRHSGAQPWSHVPCLLFLCFEGGMLSRDRVWTVDLQLVLLFGKTWELEAREPCWIKCIRGGGLWSFISWLISHLLFASWLKTRCDQGLLTIAAMPSVPLPTVHWNFEPK